MRALKVAGLFVLGLWMAFITWRLEQTRDLAMRACGLAWAANRVTGSVSYPRECPGSGLVEAETDKALPNSAPTANEGMYSEFRPIVTEYVRQKYGWSDDVYRLVFNRSEGTVLVFWVVHRDDEKSSQASTGGGKSIEVWIDPAKGQVTAEYHFQ